MICLLFQVLYYHKKQPIIAGWQGSTIST